MKKSQVVTTTVLALIQLPNARPTQNGGRSLPKTHRLHLVKSPSLVKANDTARSLERDTNLVGGDIKASICSIAPAFASMDIDTNTLLTQLGKCGVKPNILPMVINGATIKFTVEYREIDDVVVDRKSGEEINIEQAHAAITDWELELRPESKMQALLAASVDVSSLFGIGTTNAVAAIPTVDDNAPSVAPAFKFRNRNEGETEEAYNTAKDNAQKAFDLKNRVVTQPTVDEDAIASNA